MLKYISGFLCVIVLSIYAYAFSGGITGATRKNGNGCVCHGTSPSPEVVVSINGPDTILVNDSAEYKVILTGGPLVRGGTNIACRKGLLMPGPGLRTLNNELTHQSPFNPETSTVVFVFKYKAPSVIGIDTLFANGNSVNFDGFSIGDKWNFAPDKKIFITSSTGITNLNQIASGFDLHQNYPNPFNPSTKIKFELPKASQVKLVIYNSEGKITDTLVNSFLSKGSYEVKWNAVNCPSGNYFYKLTSGNFTKTNKMILIK